MKGRAGSLARLLCRGFKRDSSRWIGLTMTMLMLTSPALAQILPPPFDPTGKGAPPSPLRKEYKRPTPPPRPTLPPIPQPPAEEAEKQLGKVRVFVRDIQVTGSTVFTEEQLAEVTKPYINRTLTNDDLERLRLSLTLLYVNHGYITSGAIIPDQEVAAGVITVQIIEGALSRIDVEGNDWFRTAYLRDRVELGARTPLSLEPLQERLQMLQQDVRIRQLNAELRPGDQRGESVLNLKVVEASPWKAWIEFNNYQPPVVGAERGLATVAHQNVTGNGDMFSFTYGRSRGVDPIIDTIYVLPLNRYETTFSAYYRRNDFLVVESPFRPIDLNLDAEIIGMALRQPLYKTLTDEFAVVLIGEHLYNKVTSAFDFPGQPSSLFMPGSSPTGVGTVSAIRFAQEYTHRTVESVITARSRFSLGIDALGATINTGPVPDGQFFSWLGQVQAVRRVENWGGVQFLGRMDLQLANDRLFFLEQMPVGGRYSVRGYREVALLRDNAFIASVESRIPLLRFASGEDRLQLAPFIDMGRAWNTKDDTPDPHTLASIGAGLRWMILPQERARFEVYWGQQLNHLRLGEGNLQDHGIHFSLIFQVL